MTPGAGPRAAVAALVVCLALATDAGAAAAQTTAPGPRGTVLRGAGERGPSRVAPLLRVDVLAGSPTAVHASAGVALPVSTYLRLDASVGAGPEFDDGDARATVHGELLARFVPDPFRRAGRGIHAGGGLAWWSRSPHVVLVALVGVEGRPRRGWSPALEVGLGRGVRVGVAARRATRRR